MGKNRTRVLQVWTGWADQIASRVVYGTFGSGKANADNKGAHRFLAARRRWNQYVRWLLSEEHIDARRAMHMIGCRYQGVKLNIETPKYACQHGLCPYCYYRWLTSFLRNNQAWSKSKTLDIISWDRELDESCVFSPAQSDAAISQARQTRTTLVRQLSRSGAQGASVSLLWPFFDPDSRDVIRYLQQIVVIGKGFDQNVKIPSFGETSLGIDVDASNVWPTLQYCFYCLDMPYRVGERAAWWNQRFRAMPFKGQK